MSTLRQHLITQVRHALNELERPSSEGDIIEFTIHDKDFDYDSEYLETEMRTILVVDENHEEFRKKLREHIDEQEQDS